MLEMYVMCTYVITFKYDMDMKKKWMESERVNWIGVLPKEH